MDQFPDGDDIYSDHEDEYEAMLEAEGLAFTNKPSAPLASHNAPVNRPLPTSTQPLSETCEISIENDGTYIKYFTMDVIEDS
jgi:hypothetical protein